MTTRRKKKPDPQPAQQPTSITRVGCEINGAYISVDSVDSSTAGETLGAILEVFRDLQKHYPELRPIYGTVGGNTPIDYKDDFEMLENGLRRRRVGFRSRG